MNPEILEHLLIDRSVGELPPDTVALLDAYLSREPEAARQAAEIDETLGLARLALGDGTQSSRLPGEAELPGVADAEARRKPRPTLSRGHENPLPELTNIIPLAENLPIKRTRYSLWPLAAAACFAGGLILGLSTMRGTDTHPVAVASQPAPLVARVASSDSDFWSIKRIRSHHQTTLLTTHDQIKWSSPVRKPEIVPSL